MWIIFFSHHLYSDMSCWQQFKLHSATWLHLLALLTAQIYPPCIPEYRWTPATTTAIFTTLSCQHTLYIPIFLWQRPPNETHLLLQLLTFMQTEQANFTWWYFSNIRSVCLDFVWGTIVDSHSVELNGHTCKNPVVYLWNMCRLVDYWYIIQVTNEGELGFSDLRILIWKYILHAYKVQYVHLSSFLKLFRFPFCFFVWFDGYVKAEENETNIRGNLLEESLTFQPKWNFLLISFLL